MINKDLDLEIDLFIDSLNADIDKWRQSIYNWQDNTCNGEDDMTYTYSQKVYKTTNAKLTRVATIIFKNGTIFVEDNVEKITYQFDDVTRMGNDFMCFGAMKLKVHKLNAPSFILDMKDVQSVSLNYKQKNKATEGE